MKRLPQGDAALKFKARTNSEIPVFFFVVVVFVVCLFCF